MSTRGPARGTASGPRAIGAGVLADGCFKLALAAAYSVFAVPFAGWLAAPYWLVLVTALLLGTSGVTEILARRRPERRHVVLLATYDIAWLAISIATLIMASLGASAAGSVWLAFQAVASVALAVLFSARRSGT